MLREYGMRAADWLEMPATEFWPLVWGLSQDSRVMKVLVASLKTGDGGRVIEDETEARNALFGGW